MASLQTVENSPSVLDDATVVEDAAPAAPIKRKPRTTVRKAVDGDAAPKGRGRKPKAEATDAAPKGRGRRVKVTARKATRKAKPAAPEAVAVAAVQPTEQLAAPVIRVENLPKIFDLLNELHKLLT